MLPETWLQVTVVLTAVVPGFVYQLSRRSLRGPDPDEAAAAVRVLRAIATSAVFATLYGIALGPTVMAWVNDPVQASLDVRSISVLALALVIAVPWGAARVIYLLTTSSWYSRAAGTLLHKLGLRSPYDPTPSGWDFAFMGRGPCWVRVLTAEGLWVGGYFGYDSFASSHPEPHDLFLETGYTMNADGTFGSEVSAPDGIFVRCSDARLVDFSPA